MSHTFLDTRLYSPWEIFWYVGGFLAWTPAYVAIILRAVRRKQLEIPVVAAVGNITWEFLWGFFFHVDMGWGLQAIYMGAFILDIGILAAVVLYGAQHIQSDEVRPLFPWLLAGLTLGWLGFYITLRRTGYDLPLGSTSAYLDNLEMSGLYLWAALSMANPSRLSPVVAWSKFLGTGMVSVFVFMAYPHNDFVKFLAVASAVLDVAYIAVLTRRLKEREVADVEDAGDELLGDAVLL